VSDTEDFRKTLMEGLVGNSLQVPTLYELAGVPSHVSLSQVYRGATLFTTVDSGAFIPLMTDFIKGVVSGATAKQDLYAGIDEASVTKLIAALTKHDIPVIQTVYLPGVDLFTHEAEEPSEPSDEDPLPLQVAYLESVTDKAIGEVLATYEQLGVLDETYVLL